MTEATREAHRETLRRVYGSHTDDYGIKHYDSTYERVWKAEQLAEEDGTEEEVIPEEEEQPKDEHVHYSYYVMPNDSCTARSPSVRVSSEIVEVSCPGCMRDFIKNMMAPKEEKPNVS